MSLITMREKGETIMVFCPDTHGSIVDLDVLIERFGPDVDIVDIRAALLQACRCRRCGQRGDSLIRSPLTGHDSR